MWPSWLWRATFMSWMLWWAHLLYLAANGGQAVGVEMVLTVCGTSEVVSLQYLWAIVLDAHCAPGRRLACSD